MLPIRYIISDPETLERVSAEAVEDAALDGSRYVELRFSASHMLLGGMQADDIARGLSRGMAAAKRKTGIGGCLIAGITRELEFEMAEAITEFAINHMQDGILGMDLFGDERVPPKRFQPLFNRAHAAGLGITIHAGEAGGAENIRTAVEDLHASRIGHGVRIVEDTAVMELVKSHGILLEICPTSNVQTGAVASMKTHALPIILKRGIQMALSTDDPQFCGTTLPREYAIAHRELGVPKETLAQMASVAARHVFDKSWKML